MFRVALNEVMAETFAQVDFIFAATNPDVAFNAAGPMATTIGDRDLIAEFGFERALGNNGALTMPANLAGQPGRLHPRRHRRRPPRRHADHRPPPRGATPARPGPGGRARTPLAPRAPGSPH